MPSQHPATAQATSTPAKVAALAAGEFARRLGSIRTDTGAPVRNIFVSSLDGEVPPLAGLLRGGGRGGQLRVKLYLSLLWVCTAAPYEAAYPARAWAALLGLEDPDNKGARRIQEAIRDLDDRKMISVRDRGGLPSVLTLLDEGGLGQAYTPPSKSYNALRTSRAPREALQRQQYFKIPSKIWTDGHLARLKGPGVAMLTVLYCEQRGQTGNEVWFSPEIAKDRFHLAPTTRTAGLAELRGRNLITTRQAPVSHDGTYIGFQRRRAVHTLLIS